MERVNMEKEGRLVYLTINNPPVNALNSKVLEDLEKAVNEIARDDEVTVVILTGEGDKAYVAGADISEFPQLNRENGEKMSRRGQEILQKLYQLPAVVISSIHGYALGGGMEVALASDIRIVADNAKLGLPEVTLGIYPGFGGTQRLPRLIPEGKAKELIFTGAMIDAEEAYRLGIADHVVPAGEEKDKALEIAKKILKNGPLGVKAAKKAVNEGLNLTLSEAFKMEASYFGEICDSEDQKEGAKAFLEKRKPEFKGK